MIRVEVKPYCESCPDFEPDVERPSRIYAGDELFMQTDTIVRCEHRERCEMIRKYLESQKEK